MTFATNQHVWCQFGILLLLRLTYNFQVIQAACDATTSRKAAQNYAIQIQEYNAKRNLKLYESFLYILHIVIYIKSIVYLMRIIFARNFNTKKMYGYKYKKNSILLIIFYYLQALKHIKAVRKEFGRYLSNRDRKIYIKEMIQVGAINQRQVWLKLLVKVQDCTRRNCSKSQSMGESNKNQAVTAAFYKELHEIFLKQQIKKPISIVNYILQENQSNWESESKAKLQLRINVV